MSTKTPSTDNFLESLNFLLSSISVTNFFPIIFLISCPSTNIIFLFAATRFLFIGSGFNLFLAIIIRPDFYFF